MCNERDPQQPLTCTHTRQCILSQVALICSFHLWKGSLTETSEAWTGYYSCSTFPTDQTNNVLIHLSIHSDFPTLSVALSSDTIGSFWMHESLKTLICSLIFKKGSANYNSWQLHTAFTKITMWATPPWDVVWASIWTFLTSVFSYPNKMDRSYVNSYCPLLCLVI